MSEPKNLQTRAFERVYSTETSDASRPDKWIAKIRVTSDRGALSVGTEAGTTVTVGRMDFLVRQYPKQCA